MGIIDSEENYKRIKIGSMNFQGWKKIKVNIKNKLLQDDIILNKHEVLTFQSIYFHLGTSGKNMKESIIILDDILAETRDKYKISEELKTLTY